MGKSPHPRPLAGLLALAVLVMVGCGRTLIGDPGAEPVTIEVDLERAWVRLHSEDVILVGDGPTAADGREASFGFGHGTWVGTTEVTLIGRAEVDGRHLFTVPLSWGRTAFTLPLRSGRSLQLTVTIDGERRGRVVLPTQRVEGQRLTLDLSAAAAQPEGASEAW